VQEHCREDIPDEACLLELGWYIEEVIVIYMEYKRCEEKGCYIKANKGQKVISEKQRWYGY